SAVMLAGWFGRTGAGLFAVVVSMPAVGYYFIAPYRAFGMELDEIPYFLSFLLSAVVTSWLASARKDTEEKQSAQLDELFEKTKGRHTPGGVGSIVSGCHRRRLHRLLLDLSRYH